MRVLIADDHPLFRDALRAAVQRVIPCSTLVHAATLKDALSALAAQDFNLLLLDLHMTDSEGFTGLITIRHDYPSLPVVVSASEGDEVIDRSLAFGQRSMSRNQPRWMKSVRRSHRLI